ncbi:MAG TPA: alpha/beta hydrolase [Steroidobacteraceae bacterium]|jgi:acetyl esterase/lipase|nr:alpha/beta hydrolase [Steroidobacteraceae bacterium]
MSLDILAMAARIRALGDQIVPAAIEGTAKLYGPYHEREPYQGVKVSRDQAYGADARHLLDVFEPQTSGAARPVLLFVHGGGFVAGDKHRPGSPYQDNVALWAVRHGMVGVNMTYRLAPQHPWPAGAMDVGAAIAWVHAHIAQHGGDPARIYLMGTSAGAAHAGAYTVNSRFHGGEDAGIAGLILLSGLYDMVTAPGSDLKIAYFGHDEANYAAGSTLNGLTHSKIPLLLVLTEMDPPEFQRQTMVLLNQSLKHNGRLPFFVHMTGHNHLSSTMHLNTTDVYLGERIQDFVALTGPAVS